MFYRTLLGSLALVWVVADPGQAHADSGRFNLHFDVGGIVAGAPVAGGGGFHVGADLVLRKPVALDVVLGAGGIAHKNDFAGTVGTWFVDFAVGVRVRFLDDQRGNLFLIPRLGLFVSDFSLNGSFDATLGYEWKVADRVQIGPFVRPGVIFNADGAGGYAMVGVVVSVRVIDMPKDQDRDGVVDSRDECPDTPYGSDVDARGCVKLRKAMVLTGITFELDRTDITSQSAPTLKRALHVLRDNPRVRVEIGGHTDDVGTAPHNQRLSEDRAQAVLAWLVSHGIDASLLSAKGYGSAQPVAPNSDEAGRGRNRRIEFRRLDE